MLMLTEADNGRAAEMKVGDSVRISLPENATTGFRWAIDKLDTNMFEETASEPHYAGEAVGSGGRVAFTLRAKKAGEGSIALKYWRHFEGDSSVSDRFNLRLTVTN